MANLLDFKKIAKYFPAPIRKAWGAFIDAIIYAGPGFTDEPTGFPNRTDSAISFDDGNRKFTIEPVSDSFLYLFKGELITVSEAVEVVIGDPTGLYHIYFDEDGALVSVSGAVSPFDLIRDNVYVANIYWDAPNSKSVIQGDERHGLMPWQSHWLQHHYNGGALYGGDGLTFHDIHTDEDGSSDTHVQFAAAGGNFADEDIYHVIQGRPLAGFTIPIIAKTGSSPTWFTVAENDAPIVLDSGVPQYNYWNGASWVQQGVTSTKYFLAHIIATNDWRASHGFISIQGENQYDSKNAARLGATVEMKAFEIENLPIADGLPLGTFIVEYKSSYTNTYSSRFVSTDLGDDYVSWLYWSPNEPTVLMASMRMSTQSILTGTATLTGAGWHTVFDESPGTGLTVNIVRKTSIATTDVEFRVTLDGVEFLSDTVSLLGGPQVILGVSADSQYPLPLFANYSILIEARHAGGPASPEIQAFGMSYA